VEEYFGADRRRIDHAGEVFSHAVRIARSEGADRDVVMMAAFLHDVGIKPAEERFGTSAAKYQEMLGPAAAGEILAALGVDRARIEEVKLIIAHHHTPGVVKTKEFFCLWDADMIVNLKEAAPTMDAARLESIVASRFMTAEGRRIAREVLRPGR